MEPITTAWIMSTIISGWLGNRADFWLCKGTNQIYEQITKNINEPANHDVQKAIRRSYLKAGVLAVKHVKSQRTRFSLTDISRANLK